MLQSSGCAILQPCISIPSLRRFIAGALSRPEMYQRFFRLCRRRLQGMRNSKAANSKRRQRWAHGSCSWTHGPSSRSIPTSVQSTRQLVHHMARAVPAGPAVRRGHLDRALLGRNSLQMRSGSTGAGVPNRRLPAQRSACLQISVTRYRVRHQW